MKLPPFKLDRWLDAKYSANSDSFYDLGSSVGPKWTFEELLNLANGEEKELFWKTQLSYPPGKGTDLLRSAIAEYQNVSVETVQITNGASEALLVIFATVAQSGANVILPSPHFPTIGEIPKWLGIETRLYHLNPEKRFKMDLEDVKKLVDNNTQIILINSPHNPTGSITSLEDINEIHDFCVERKIKLVVDEVYHPIYYLPEMPSASSLPNATIIGSLSKAFCLSGLRVGWIIEKDYDLANKYFDARGYYTISNSPLSEALAVIALKNRKKVLQRAHQTTTANLTVLQNFFVEHQEKLSWVPPLGGMTIFPWLNSREDARSFCQAALNNGVLIVPGDCFYMAAHFRLGFGTMDEMNFGNALGILSEIIKSDFSSSI